MLTAVLTACATSSKNPIPDPLDEEALRTIDEISRVTLASDRLRTLVNLAKNQKASEIAGEDTKDSVENEINQLREALGDLSPAEMEFIDVMVSRCELVLPQKSRSTSQGFYERSKDGFKGRHCPVEQSSDMETEIIARPKSQQSTTRSRFHYKFKDDLGFSRIASVDFGQKVFILATASDHRTEISGPVVVTFRDRSSLVIDGDFRITGSPKDRRANIEYKYIFKDITGKPIGRHSLLAHGTGEGEVKDSIETWQMFGTFDGKALTEEVFQRVLFPHLAR